MFSTDGSPEAQRFLAERGIPTATGEEQRFELRDERGVRTLVVPAGEPPFTGDPTPYVRRIEVLTRTRLRDGGNPLWFIRFYHQFEGWTAREVSFAEYCRQQHAERVETEPDDKVVANDFTHSDDFASVRWGDRDFVFATPQQRAVVQALWEAMLNGTPVVGLGMLAEAAGSAAGHFKMAHVFRNKKDGEYVRHPALGSMIREARKGCYRLVAP